MILENMVELVNNQDRVVCDDTGVFILFLTELDGTNILTDLVNIIPKRVRNLLLIHVYHWVKED